MQKSKEVGFMQDLSILDSDGNILYEAFDFESEDEAEAAASEYIQDNEIEDYMLDISQPDC